MMLGENKNEELHIVQKYRANDILIPLGSYHIDLLLEPPPPNGTRTDIFLWCDIS